MTIFDQPAKPAWEHSEQGELKIPLKEINREPYPSKRLFCF